MQIFLFNNNNVTNNVDAVLDLRMNGPSKLSHSDRRSYDEPPALESIYNRAPCDYVGG